MNKQIFTKVELDIIDKFSKYIIRYKNNKEFLEYIKKSEFKVDAFGLNRWLSSKYHKRIERYLFYNYNNKYRQIDKNKFKVLSFFEYIAIFLKKKDKKLWLLPLNDFIRRIENWKVDINNLMIDMDSFNNKFKNKQVMIYLNKKSMDYDVSDHEINVETIYRKYVGTKKFKDGGLEETRILVESPDGTIMDINQEAIHHFQEKGFRAVLTKEWKKNYLYNFLEKKEVVNIFKKNDLKRIQEREKIERPYQFSLTGFPDLFVWNRKGDYFFVEVKSEKDKLHRSQYEWIRWNKKKGKFDFKMLNILNKK